MLTAAHAAGDLGQLDLQSQQVAPPRQDSMPAYAASMQSYSPTEQCSPNGRRQVQASFPCRGHIDRHL